MTPTEWQHVRAIICRIWPRVAQRMTDTDWKIISERAMTLGIQPIQADHALEELRATDDKYPTPAKILTVLRRLDVRPARTAQTAVEEATGPRFRLWQMRQMLVLGEDYADSAVVRAHYTQAANRSIRLRGFLRPSWFAHAENDLIELGGWDQASAEGWTLEIGGQYPHERPAGPATELQAWYAGVESRGIPALVKALAAEHDARPQIDKAQRQTVCDELQSLPVSEIQDLAGEKTGARS